MLITYLVTVYNKEKYIGHVIDSLKSIKGNFRKEFIIINDGSTDESLAIIKKHAADLPKATIINQKNQGPAISINIGLGIATGDWVHFVDGDDIVAPDATQLLFDACKAFATQVAYGLRGSFDYDSGLFKPSKRGGGEAILISDPLRSILAGRMPKIRTIGSSGSFVSRSLLVQVGGADRRLFVQDLPISLVCAKYSSFAFVPQTVCYEPSVFGSDHLSYDKQFEAENTLKAVLYFIRDNKEIAESLQPELYHLLWSIRWKLNKFSPRLLYRYICAKYMNRGRDVKDLIALYEKQL